MIANAGRFFRTIRHLRPIQFYGRLWFRLYRPCPDMAPPPALRSIQGVWHCHVARAVNLVGPTRFRFLNLEADLSEIGWDDPRQAKLWRYNQHYFDDLNATGSKRRSAWHSALIDAWIIGNPPGKGTGWEPYPTSLRIINWVKWALSGNVLPDGAAASLAIQARWLARRIEWHLLGNHLFTNAKALIFAGLFFEGSEADAWLSKGTKILNREIVEQILPDGAQFELSPMYHALAVEDMLDLVNIAGAYRQQHLTKDWCQRIPAMISWLETLSHPDGKIAFFNDAAFGIAPVSADLVQYANRLGFENSASTLPLLHLKESGYVRMREGPFALIADVGPVGPNYLPGHAHADTLSIELSIDGQRVFVNSGTSEYGSSAERQRQRGTAAHNTVTVHDENSSEVWAGFRVGRRARPLNVVVEKRDRMLRVQASHDGYRFLLHRPVVTRCIELDENCLKITDTITTSIRAMARYHLHPEVTVSNVTSKNAILELPGGKRFVAECEGGGLQVEATTWHPEFGVSTPNCCLILPLADQRASLRLVST